MLRTLAIRNFTIIDELELEFAPGFSAITGETGAGKSILVDALGLVMGDRATGGLVAPDAEQAEISAIFRVDEASAAGEWLREQAMDDGDELLIRRVLAAEGGSRAWINGRSATIGQLGELGRWLVEIHGQHEHQQLERAETQRRLLDSRLKPELPAAVDEAFDQWRQASEALERFEAEDGDPDQLELLRFQCRELADLALAAGEYERLESEQERLAAADDIRRAIRQTAAALDHDDAPSVRSLLLQAGAELDDVRRLDERLDAVAGMLIEARINIDEALAELERAGGDEPEDPGRLETVNRRLQQALDLARKHRVSPQELPALGERLEVRLEQLENRGEHRQTLEREVENAAAGWRQAADRLSTARSRAAGTLADQVQQRLAELGMDQARLEFGLEPFDDDTPRRHGRERIRIGFSANPGQPLQPLGKVASGGELSRVALALMIAVEDEHSTPVRVFDEVDAGVGGETARVVGRFLRQAAGCGQAFCVTHLAQVAACADHQFRVDKQSDGDATRTRVEPLPDGERKREIARMLGSGDSRKSLAHAGELLEQER